MYTGGNTPTTTELLDVGMYFEVCTLLRQRTKLKKLAAKVDLHDKSCCEACTRIQCSRLDNIDHMIHRKNDSTHNGNKEKHSVLFSMTTHRCPPPSWGIPLLYWCPSLGPATGSQGPGIPAGNTLGPPPPPDDASAFPFVSRVAKRRSAAWKPWPWLWPWPPSTERGWWGNAAAAVFVDDSPAGVLLLVIPRGVVGAENGTLVAAVEG